MNNTPDQIDELIAAYLAGEASPDQIEFVERWRHASNENRRYFDHLRLIFARAASFRDTIPFDTDKAWNQIRKNLRKEKKAIPIRRRDADFSFLKIAAGVILLIAAGVFAYQFFADKRIQPRELLSGDETRGDTLPDGSGVFLNRDTKIEYSFVKQTDTHVARLTGEAYFDIRHEDDKNIIVEAGETFIRDIGTSFNVRAYPEAGTIEVVVEEGEVLFYTENDRGLHLKANSRGIYDRRTGRFTVGEPELNVTAYKTKRFTFSNHTLEAVVNTLNGVYETKVKIDENLKDCKIAVSFNEERIEEIVHVIAETLSLSVIREAGAIRLRGKGCGEAPSR